MERGGYVAWATACPPDNIAQACIQPHHHSPTPTTWRGHSSFGSSIDTIRGTTVTSYKSLLDWRNGEVPGVAPDGGRGFRLSHYTAIAHLKLGSLQPVRSCPTMVCHHHWVHADLEPSEQQIATIAQGNKADKTQHLPPEKYSLYPGHILERQSVQRCGPVLCWPSQNVHSVQAVQTPLTGLCPPHEPWSHPKRHPLWRAGRPRMWYNDRPRWRRILNQHFKTGEEKLMNDAEDKWIRRKERSNSSRPGTTLRCDICGRVCLSRIGLFSHRGHCSSRADIQGMLHPWSAMTEGAYYYC